MPELPEVETIKRVLEPQLRGLRIEKVRVNRPEVIAHPCAEIFCSQAEGQPVRGMERHGKFLVILLGNSAKIVLHLRMTGGLLLAPAELVPEKHTHLIFEMSDGRELRFSDMRRFGRFWLISEGEEDSYSGIDRLGIEPFAKELSAQYLQLRLGNRKKTIKECLLEQGVVAGIGNIYSDEILFTAGICPFRHAHSLEFPEWQRLAAVIPERLSYYIEKNAISAEDYLQTKGKDYRNTPYLQVYGHAKEACPVCGEILLRTVIGGRSSVWCPVCQKSGE